jgi:hypothetical protein
MPIMPDNCQVMLRRLERLKLVFILICVLASKAPAQEIRPGIWASTQIESLPIPSRGYQAFLIGELHGLQQNTEFQLDYLRVLNKASKLRDVAIEEKEVYEPQAQAFIDGKKTTLPGALCLRVALLRGIKKFNSSLRTDERIRIHLIDIDSPATAIREHLLAIAKVIPDASAVRVPEANEIKERGIEAVHKIERLCIDPRTISELRTIEYSIRSYQQGLEFGVGPAKGSPYLEDREQAVTDNIKDLVRLHSDQPILLIYGFDHVSRSQRSDGGPSRDQPFEPVAARLEQSGVKIFCLVTFPLEGTSFWRGARTELPWKPVNGHLTSGETLDHVLKSAPRARFLYADVKDTKGKHIRLPSLDVSNFNVDAFLLFPSTSPMEDECTGH